MTMKIAINEENIVRSLEQVKALLTEADQLKIYKETSKFVNRGKRYENLSDEDCESVYFARLEAILVSSRNAAKLKSQFGTYAKAALFVGIGIFCSLLALGAAGLALGGAATLAIFAPLSFPIAMVFGFFGVPSLLVLGGAAVFALLHKTYTKASSVLAEGKIEIDERKVKLNEGTQAYNEIFSFFASPSADKSARLNKEEQKEEEFSSTSSNSASAF